MIVAFLLGLLFIIVTSTFLFFLLFILYPSLEQQNFSMNDPFVMPWAAGWPEGTKKSPFLFNSPSDCHVVRLIHSGKEGRQDLCASFEKCVDTCPRLNFTFPERACAFEREMETERGMNNYGFLKKLAPIQKKLRDKMEKKKRGKA
jgi:hypothetical protein